MDRAPSIETRFDSLLKEYRSACPEPEGSPAFTSSLWQRIEAQKAFLRNARSWTSAYVTIAALVCLLLALLISIQAGSTQKTYVDILNDNQDTSVLIEASRPAQESQ